MNKVRIILLAAVLSALGGCVSTEDAELETEDAELERRTGSMLYSRDLDNGSVVEWYEPYPGVVLFSEAGPAGNTPVTAQHPGIARLSAAQTYMTLFPGSEAPRALVEADRRAEQLTAELGSSPDIAQAASTIDMGGGTAETPGESSLSGSCSSSWFESSQCDGSAPFTYCLLDWWNGAYAYHSDMCFFHTSVCADIGDVTLQVKIDGDVVYNWSVLEGTYRYYEYQAGSNPFDFCVNFLGRSDVLNASGDRFHYSAWALLED